MALLPGLSSGLLPASFRGVPFGTVATGVAGGRRVALHVYPGRDDPWAEDMGKAPRQFRLRGFVLEGDITFLGGPVILQRTLLLAALEKSGPGTLTHPTLGVLNVSVRGFTMSEELDASRRSAVEIDFVESGKQSFPSLLSSGSGILSAATLCKVALAADAVRVIAGAIGAGGSRADVAATASAWSDQASALGSDATSLHRLASQLPGEFGRFVSGGNAGLNGLRATPYNANTTIADLTEIASAARVAIADAASDLTTAVLDADLSSAKDIPAAITALVQALADACADPSDAIRLLEDLIAFAPNGLSAGTTVGQAVAAMFQRAAAAALATAVGEYQPTSADDAAALVGSIAPLLDSLATAAADGGDDQSFLALRAARVAIVTDLRARGGSLAQITTFTLGRPLPAVVLAQRLYRDPARADQLVGQVPCIHPLFMPTSFEALAA